MEHQTTGQVQICSKSNVTTANKAAMVATLEIDYRLLPNRLLALDSMTFYAGHQAIIEIQIHSKLIMTSQQPLWLPLCPLLESAFQN